MISPDMSRRLSRVLVGLRLVPSSAGSGSDEGHERYRRAGIASVANVAELASSVLVTIASVWLTLPYLGRERMGVWLTVASFTSLLSFMDLGVGNALIGRVAATSARSAASRSQVLVGGLGLMALVGASVSITLFVAADLVPWQIVIAKKAQSTSLIEEFRDCAQVFAIFFGISLFSGAVKKVFQGLQQAYYGSAAMFGANVFSLVALIFESHLHAGTAVLLSVTFGVSAIGPLVLLPALWREIAVPLRVVRQCIRREAKHLLVVGGMFFLIQIGVLINTSSETLIIATILGPAAVSLYAISQKPFQFCSLPIRVISAALWPSYADAYHRGDRVFIRNTLRHQLMLAAILVSGGTVAVALTHHWLVEIWTSHQVSVPPVITIAFAMWTMLEGMTLPFASYMNGCGKIRPQAIASVFSIFTFLPVKIFALTYWGLSGMIFTSTAFFALNLILFYFVLFPREVFEPLKIAEQ